MKTVLITGVQGFIGRNLKEQLCSDFYLLCPPRRELDLLNQDELYKYFQKHKIDAVIHTASVGRVLHNVSDTNIIYPNLLMFYNLMQIRKYNQRVIFIGSGAEYDKRNPLIKVKESDFGKYVPVDEYGLCKYICSKYIENTENVINLRPFGIYGKYEGASRLFCETINKCLKNQSIVIKQNVKFDYLYINDFIEIIKYFLIHKPQYKFYNIGTGKVRDIKSVAQTIIKISGKKLKVSVQTPGWQNEYSCDISRLKSEIPNLKFTELDDTVKTLIRYYSKGTK